MTRPFREYVYGPQRVTLHQASNSPLRSTQVTLRDEAEASHFRALLIEAHPALAACTTTVGGSYRIITVAGVHLTPEDFEPILVRLMEHRARVREIASGGGR
jgi:hypothetical protein